MPRPLLVRNARLPVVVLGSLLAAMACKRQRFPPRGDAPPVVVVVPRHDAAPAPKTAEREPNDRPEQAQTLAINGSSALVSLEGSLQGSGEGRRKDADVFKLVVPGERQAPVKVAESIDSGTKPEDPRASARRLWVELGSTGCSRLGLELLDESGKSLESVSVEALGGMPNLAVLPGVAYYLRVKPAGKAAKSSVVPEAACRYVLTVKLADFQIADEREPNGEMATANPIELVGTSELGGYHGWPRDRDFYRIPLPEVVSALNVELEAVPGVAAGLEVLDGGGSRLAFGKGHKGERLALHNVNLQPASAKGAVDLRQAFVVVRSEVGEHRGQQYVLRLSLGARKLDAEVEPNDRPEQATVVEDGTYSGYLPTGDVDFFRYEGEGRRNVNFEVSFPRRIRGKLQLFGPGRLGPGTAEAKRPRQLLAVADVATPGQPIYLQVASRRGDGNANEPYSLKVTSAPSPTTSEKPPTAKPPEPATQR